MAFYDKINIIGGYFYEIYPNSMKSWKKNWGVTSPIFKFSLEVGKVIYTTNAI